MKRRRSMGLSPKEQAYLKGWEAFRQGIALDKGSAPNWQEGWQEASRHFGGIPDKVCPDCDGSGVIADRWTYHPCRNEFHK